MYGIHDMRTKISLCITLFYTSFSVRLMYGHHCNNPRLTQCKLKAIILGIVSRRLFKPVHNTRLKIEMCLSKQISWQHLAGCHELGQSFGINQLTHDVFFNRQSTFQWEPTVLLFLNTFDFILGLFKKKKNTKQNPLTSISTTKMKFSYYINQNLDNTLNTCIPSNFR